ncbi:hypothetical protein IWZ01DRAFT_91461 [Phyllosticta capitalensis]
MDVRKWLEDTVGPGPPATLTLPPGRDAREEPVQGVARTSSHQPRRCNHLFSDSSLLHVEPADNAQGFSAHQPDHIGRPRRRSVEDEDRPTTAPSDTSDSHHPDLYTRRPRHKTRPEIYEPKPGVDREDKKRRRKKEKEGRGKKAPKSRRRAGKDKPPHQTHLFQPKNVTKERLTMKPNESIGLFKKGRASTPIKGRGLPDLVFSEMRFLQKQDDTKEKTQEETRNKRKRKNPNQVPEHELSAYFGAKRPPLVDKDHNIQRRRSEHRSKSASLGQRPLSRASTRIESARPAIELPDKPYLGFGSRGDPVASDPTYYIPWSESVRNASVQPSEAPLPLRRSSLQPHDFDSPAKESNNGHDGREPGACGKVKVSQRAVKVAVQSESGNGSGEGIPRSVERREGDSDPEILVERLRSNMSPVTVPDEKPRPRNKGRRSTERIRERIMNADRGQEINCAVEGAGKLHEPSRPVSDPSAPHRQGSRTCEKIARSPNADGNESDHERSQRSSSPLDRLLRDCDRACHESYYGRGNPSLGPVLDTPPATKDGRIEELEQVYRPSMPQRWASGGIPGQPTLFERQWPEDEVDYEGEDFDMDNHVDVSAGIGTREIGWTGNSIDEAIVPSRGYWEDFGGWTGAEVGVAEARDDVQEPQWCWRRHRLY